MSRQNDESILRELAAQYRELCDSERNQAAVARWRALNNLKSERPLVYCNTGLLGGEIHPHLPECRTEDGELRRVEGWFHHQLWHAGLGDDRIFTPWFDVGAGMFRQPEGLWGVSPDRVWDKDSRGWRHMPVLKKMEDLDKLKATEHRVINPDPPLAGRLGDIFGDILPVHIKRSTIYPVWGGTDLSEAPGTLFGIEELLYLLIDAPEMIHRFMAFTRDAVLANLKQGEAAGDWSTADSWYYLTPPHCDDLPDPAPNTHGARLKDLAYFSHAQEFEGVSPAQHQEFILEYQMPIMELFGKITYGCCDTLDNKLDLIRRIPNLAKIVSGPLSDPGRYPEMFGDDCVISWRPMASMVAGAHFDEALQRRQLREGFEKLKGCQVEVHMHEPMTVQGDVTRIKGWADIAREEAEGSVQNLSHFG
ncbi:MAG: hypothetical protein ACYTGH_04145 [Planctomycetota bacterium]|jgi:hypothetical protein